jgi:hypothetical protein
VVVLVEGTDQILIKLISKEQLVLFFSELIKRRKEKSDSLAQRIEQYEKKRMAEERIYSSMSPLRKLITGRRPDHHLAVEYMVYVKRPLQEIDELTFQIKLLEQLVKQTEEEEQEQLYMSPSIAGELLQLAEREGLVNKHEHTAIKHWS